MGVFVPSTPEDVGAAPAAKGVTNGDLHDHSGGDGANIPWDTGISGKPSTFTPSAHKTSHSTGGADALTAGNIGAESALGNPSVNGYVLSSTTGGQRSWISNKDGYPVCNNSTGFPANPVAGQAVYHQDRKILYVYEGFWQPIESYGDIALYLASNGNDSNTGWASNSAKATLAAIWAEIPRLYGGNIIIWVTGQVPLSADIYLGGKHAVAGAYSIQFIGVDTVTTLKSFQTGTGGGGTMAESGNTRGTITGMTIVEAPQAFRGQLLKNTTNNWYTIVQSNTQAANSAILESVGSFNSGTVNNGLYSPARTVGANDSWEIRNFGGGFSGAYAIYVQCSDVEFHRLHFIGIFLRINAQRFKSSACRITTYGQSPFIGHSVPASAVFTNLFLDGSSFRAPIISTMSMCIFEGFGMYGVDANSYCILAQTSSYVQFADIVRLDHLNNPSGGSGIWARYSSTARAVNVPGTSRIKNSLYALTATNFSTIEFTNLEKPGCPNATSNITGATTDAVITTS